MCFNNQGFSQEDTLKPVFSDTLVMNDGSIDKPIYYGASDSIYSDLKNQQIHLYRDARIDNGEVQMEAGYIMIDLKKNEVYATYIYDEDSNRIQLPEFKDGGETMTAATIRYNFDTKKGYIEEVAIQQDELYIYMEIAKKHPNDEIHFRKGRITTCDLEEPHYHFQLSKAVLVPEKRIVSGAMNLWVQGVPTPLGLPFAIIPQSEDRTHGIIFPVIVPLSAAGFGLKDLGYYIPINDQVHTTFFGSIYSRGTWELRNTTEYKKLYKFGGNLNLGFQQNRSGFPTNTTRNKLSIAWNHIMDPKANPYWNFNSRVNFISDNDSKTNIDPDFEVYSSNSFNSDINLQRLFPGRPITSGLKIGLKQSTTNNSISLSSPIINFNVSRIFPFKNVGRKPNPLNKLGFTYNFEGKNQSNFGDSLLSNGDFAAIGREFKNGFSNRFKVQTTIALFKNTWKITPSVSYDNYINFQGVTKQYDPTDSTVVATRNDNVGMAHNLAFSADIGTTLYSYYKFVGENKPILRHVLTPKFSFSYIPKLNEVSTYELALGFDTTLVNYSRFENSAYAVGATANDQAIFRYSFNNTFELKKRSDKDTITGFKKTRIIDAFSLSGNYDFLKSEFNWSDISASLRISPVTWLNFVASSSFSGYGWNDSTGVRVNKPAGAINGILGRFTRNNFTTTVTITSKSSQKKLDSSRDNIQPHWNADYEYFMLHPEFVVDFEIPWKVSLSHVYSINQNTNTTTYAQEKYAQVQTIMMNGDLSITKRWKLTANINMDLKDIKVTNARFSLIRDMHCWRLEFHWVPIGGNKSFMFSMRSTSSLLKDAKFDLRKPPAFL
ncbi:MAG: putative LPS assembly protein LptD [Crocinitomicaceae bacterium]|nr:putative LPS assembly protein LptD [Crocinitomicaceae bacterium]